MRVSWAWQSETWAVIAHNVNVPLLRHIVCVCVCVCVYVCLAVSAWPTAPDVC